MADAYDYAFIFHPHSGTYNSGRHILFNLYIERHRQEVNGGTDEWNKNDGTVNELKVALGVHDMHVIYLSKLSEAIDRQAWRNRWHQQIQNIRMG